MLPCLIPLLLWQPNADAIRRLFEENLARRQDARAARDLGLFLKRQGDTAGARMVLAQAVRMDEKESGPTAAATLSDVAELASVSPPAQAERLWRRAARSGNPSLASAALASLAELREAAGDRATAAGLLRQAVAKEEAAAGRDSPIVAVRLIALGHALPAREGVAPVERALAIERQALGDRHPETASTMANLAGLYVNTGHAEEALRLATAAISIFEETLGDGHPRIATACSIAAFASRQKGDPAQAEKFYRRALDIDRQAYGPQSPETLEDQRNLAELLRERQKPQGR